MQWLRKVKTSSKGSFQSSTVEEAETGMSTCRCVERGKVRGCVKKQEKRAVRDGRIKQVRLRQMSLIISYKNIPVNAIAPSSVLRTCPRCGRRVAHVRTHRTSAEVRGRPSRLSISIAAETNQGRRREGKPWSELDM